MLRRVSLAGGAGAITCLSRAGAAHAAWWISPSRFLIVLSWSTQEGSAHSPAHCAGRALGLYPIKHGAILMGSGRVLLYAAPHSLPNQRNAVTVFSATGSGSGMRARLGAPNKMRVGISGRTCRRRENAQYGKPAQRRSGHLSGALRQTCPLLPLRGECGFTHTVGWGIDTAPLRHYPSCWPGWSTVSFPGNSRIAGPLSLRLRLIVCVHSVGEKCV